MGQRLSLTVQPPLGGVVARTSFQTQPPFTAYNSQNFWPVDPRTGRSVLSVRPALTEQTLPVQGSVNLIERINGFAAGKPFQSMIISIDGQVYWRDDVSWIAATGSQAGNVTTGRSVFGKAFLQQVFICNNTTVPLVFDYPAGTVELLVASAGTAPSDTRMAAVWQGALWLAGEIAFPHILYGSRTGDATDWDFGAPLADEGGAFATTGENEGLLSGPITALMPQTSDVMIVSTVEGLMAMRAHPRRGGIFDPINSSTYVMGQGAWCKVPGDVLYMLTPLGMMTLDPVPGATPAQVSRELIPDELLGLIYNYEDPVVNMEYDSRWNGIVITVRGVEQQAWWYDISNGGFWQMDFLGYPFRLLEFPPFVTEDTSGVLFGGSAYGGLALLDRFGEESFDSTVAIGPVKISQNSLQKSIIHKARVVFGRNTPEDSVTANIKIAVGTDGQDAVSRLLAGDHQYETDLASLEINNGVIHPKISGHAAVIGIEQSEGQLVIEEIELDIENSGANRMKRSPQLSVDGDATVFGEEDFDMDDWEGYSPATPDDPNCTLPDHTHFIDLSLLPSSWWAAVAEDGSDIRATDGNNDSLPFDLIEFDFATQTGFATVRLTQTIPARQVRLWAGNPNAILPDPTSAFGQYNAYDTNWIGFWPNGGFNDRTVNLNNCTMVGTDETSIMPGPIGSFSTRYNHLDPTNNYGLATAVVPSTYPMTLVVAALDPDTSSLPCFGVRDQSGPTQANLELTVVRAAGPVQRTDSGSTDVTGLASEAQSTQIAAMDVWRHHVATIGGAASRSAFIEGANKVTNTATITIPSGVLDEIVIGKGSRSGLFSTSFTGDLSLAQVHNTERSDCWIDYQYRMMDQADFWNGWGDFEEVNPPDPPPQPDPGACPGGIVPVTETGTWSGFAQGIPQVVPQVGLKDWSHWIDLSLMPVDWWNAVSATGVDIRATTGGNKFIGLDLIDFDKTAMTGFAVVKLTQSVSVQNPIRLWVGNATAVTVPPCAAYGQYAAYDQFWVGFWPDGGGDDRTSFRNHFTMFGGVVPGTEAGPIGNAATLYDGVNDYGIVTSNTNNPLDRAPITLTAVVRDETLAATTQRHILGLRDSGSYANVALGHANDATAGQEGTTYLFMRENYGQIQNVSAGVTQAINTWFHTAAFVYPTGPRRALVNGTSPSTRHTGARPTYSFHSLNQMYVGAQPLGSSGTLGSQRPYRGKLSLLGAHDTIRGFDARAGSDVDELRGRGWYLYQTAMLNQNNFWGGPWTWTAQMSTLPQ